MRNTKPVYAIGIDPGTKTGIAVWHITQERWFDVKTMKIHQAMAYVEAIQANNRVHVVFEDARKRKALPKGIDRLQGAGSVKRDCAIWDGFLTDLAKNGNLTFTGRAPNGKTNALAKNKELAQKNLGLTGDTSEHARCAAFLVWKF